MKELRLCRAVYELIGSSNIMPYEVKTKVISYAGDFDCNAFTIS